MIPGMNPRKVQQMMKQMGIQQTDLDAVQVIIKTRDKQLIFDNPQVASVNMMGQKTFQLQGEFREESLNTTPDISPDDIQTVMEQTGTDEQTAKKAIESANGDLAQAIIDLSEE